MKSKKLLTLVLSIVILLNVSGLSVSANGFTNTNEEISITSDAHLKQIEDRFLNSAELSIQSNNMQNSYALTSYDIEILKSYHLKIFY